MPKYRKKTFKKGWKWSRDDCVNIVHSLSIRCPFAVHYMSIRLIFLSIRAQTGGQNPIPAVHSPQPSSPIIILKCARSYSPPLASFQKITHGAFHPHDSRAGTFSRILPMGCFMPMVLELSPTEEWQAKNSRWREGPQELPEPTPRTAS